MQCLSITLLLTAPSLLNRAGDYWWVNNVVGEKTGWLKAKVGDDQCLYSCTT